MADDDVSLEAVEKALQPDAATIDGNLADDSQEERVAKAEEVVDEKGADVHDDDPLEEEASEVIVPTTDEEGEP